MITFRDPSDGSIGTIAEGKISCSNPKTQRLLCRIAQSIPLDGRLPDRDEELLRLLPFRLEIVDRE